MAGNAHPRPQGLIRVALALTAALALALLALGPGGASAPDRAQAQSCPPQPSTLAPAGSGPARFTMLIRINQQDNVNTYVNKDAASGGLGGYIRPQDVFVINTRFETTTPLVAYNLASQLNAAFPCNRIIALNGMGFDPTLPGYALALYDHPAVWGVMTDFEPMDWNGTRATDPGRPPWLDAFKPAFKRIKAWDGRLATMLSSYLVSQGKRGGLVPINFSSWNYRQIAQDLDKKNRRLGGTKLGPLSVQTQDYCANGGPSGFRDRAAQLFDQYRYKIIKKKVKTKKGKKRTIKERRKIKPQGRPLRENLSLQISFSNTPNPNAGMAITKTSAKTAAGCARAALKRGGGAFFFFASDNSMKMLFERPEIASLRPLAAASGKPSGGIKPK